MTPEVLLIIWRLNVYHHISFCLLVASISSSWLLCMAQHISFWGFLMKISREYGASIVYRKWEPLTSTLEEDYDRKCTGHRSHISLLATLTHSLHDYSQTLFCLKRAELLFLLSNFSLLDERGTFSCDDVDGILCCVICCILNDGWLLAISLAWLLVVIVSKLQQQQQTEQFFRVVETPQREIEKQQDLPGRITILISWMPLPLEF